jgi:hypothetical protein
MQVMLDRFYAFLEGPLFPKSRGLLLVLLVPLAISFWFPLWRITMTAPQYPNGLTLDIYSYKVEGGHEGKDVAEINILNHYIGLTHIDRESLSDLDWMPFALGALMLIALRTAVIGNVRALVDLSVLTVYVLGFALFRYVYKMYVIGHHLDPDAPVKVAPFMPVIVGTKQMANFMTEAWPQLGAVLVGVYALGVVGVLAWHLVSGRRTAIRANRPAQPAGPAPRGATPAHP